MGAVGVFESQVHDEIGMQISIGFTDVEPTVDEVVAQEGSEDLGRRVDVRDARKATGAGRDDRGDRPGEGVLARTTGGVDEIGERRVGEIAVGDPDLGRTPRTRLCAYRGEVR